MGATLSTFFFGADQRLARGQEGRLRSHSKILYLVAVIAVLALVNAGVVGPSRGMALLVGWPAVSLAGEPTPGTAPTPAAEAEQPSGEVQERAVRNAPRGAVALKNYWKPDQYVNIESGPLVAGPIQPGWLSAQWTMEPVAPGSALYRIRNVWKPDQYLNIESGPLVAGPIQPGWLSAQWTTEPVAPGSALYRIRNVWKPDQYLNIESGPLVAVPMQPGWLSSQWTAVPVAQGEA